MITKANNTVLDLSDINQILDMGGNRITNVADPVLASDVATRNFVDTQVGKTRLIFDSFKQTQPHRDT